MSLSNFIPNVWSARLLENLNNAHVFANLVNRDYEGEIRQLGDTVKINSIGHVTIGNYTKNTDMSAAETLTDAQTTLVIDKAKYFNFQIDDIDKAQTKPKVMDAAMRDSAWGLADEVDKLFAALHATATTKKGTTGAPEIGGVLTAGSALYDLLIYLSIKLDEYNTPRQGRWIVVPPWVHGYLLKDSRFINSTDMGNQMRTNAMVGRVAGFDVYISNNVVKGGTAESDYHAVIAGHPMAISYAEQIASVEAYRPQLRFADAVKGLLVFGYKLVRPNNIATLYVKQAAS